MATVPSPPTKGTPDIGDFVAGLCSSSHRHAVLCCSSTQPERRGDASAAGGRQPAERHRRGGTAIRGAVGGHPHRRPQRLLLPMPRWLGIVQERLQGERLRATERRHHVVCHVTCSSSLFRFLFLSEEAAAQPHDAQPPSVCRWRVAGAAPTRHPGIQPGVWRRKSARGERERSDPQGAVRR